MTWKISFITLLTVLLLATGCVDRDTSERAVPIIPPPPPGVPQAFAASYAPPEMMGPSKTITVQPHQTLYAVSRQTGVPIRSLIDANHLEPPYRLNAGQNLAVPQVRQHVVQPGETLYQVSRRYSVEATTLAAANHLSPPYVLKSGTALVLPPSGLAAIPPTPIASAPVTAMPAPAPSHGGSVIESQSLMPPMASLDSHGAPLSKPRPFQGGSTIQTAELTPPGAPKQSPKPATPPSQGMAAAQPDDGSDQEDAAPHSTSLAAAKPAQNMIRPRPMAPLAPIDVSALVRNHRPPTSPIFYWPARGTILAVFGPTRGGTHNDGVNIAAPEGTVVSAADSGVVAYAGDQLKGFGNLLLIKHDGGWVSAYAHNQVLLVTKGQAVRRGQPIARIGSTGGVTQPQLHFELRQGVRAVDPLDHLPPLTAVSG